MDPIGVEIIRLPVYFPQGGGTGRPQTHTISVPALSVVLGAALLPPYYLDTAGRVLKGARAPLYKILAGYKLHVEVDGAPLLDGEPARMVLGEVGQRTLYRSLDVDPVVLTPRKDGAEVMVGIEARRGRKGAPMPRATEAWELWLHVGR